MDLPSLLHDLHLSSSSEKLLPSSSPPPITELLSHLQDKLSGSSSDSETIALIGRVERLFQTADPDWLFSAGQDVGRAELQKAYGGLVSALIGRAALPLCEDDGGGSLPAAAYQSVPSQAGPVCTALMALLRTLGNVGGQMGLLMAIAPSVCVLAVTHFQVQAWTRTWTREAAEALQKELLRAGGWRDSTPSLLLCDDYKPENCMLGVQCLHYIILNTPAADLRHFNRAEVLYQALIKHLNQRESDVIKVVLICLLDLLLVLERSPSSLDPSSSRRKPSRHDDVLRLLLTHMEVEHRVALRRIYAAALPAYVDRMGVAVCRHLRRVDRVVLGYLEVQDPPEETSRLKVLEVLNLTIRAAWPRMVSRVPLLLRCLLKLLVDVSSDTGLSEAVRQQLQQETCLSLRLLDACCHGDLQHLLQQVDSSCCSSEVLGCLATVTTATER